MTPFTIPTININQHDKIKPQTISSINKENMVVRFHENYDPCEINKISKNGQLKSILNILKSLSQSTADAPSFCGKIVNTIKLPSPDNEYSIFDKFQYTEGLFEIKTGGTSRVFGFIMGGSSSYPASFNIVAITNKHLET